MGQATFNQVSFWGRNDDGSETTATFKGVQGSDWSQDVDTKFRVRFLIDEQNVKAWSSTGFSLYYQINGGGYIAVTNTTPIQYTSSLNYTSGTDATSQLTGGSGTFLTDNNGMVHSTATATNAGAINQYFEAEYCLLIDSAQVLNADVINLRVYTGTTALNSYVDEPTITVIDEYVYTGIIFQDGFESGDFTGWDSGASGTPTVVTSMSPPEGTYCQESYLDGIATDEDVEEVSSISSHATDKIRFRFYFNLNNLVANMSSTSDYVQMCRIQSQTGVLVNTLVFYAYYLTSTTYRLRLRLIDDASSASNIDYDGLPANDGWHYFEAYMLRETGTSQNGTLQAWLDNTSIGTLSNLDNGNVIDGLYNVQMGNVNVSGTQTGYIYTDAMVVRDDDTQIGAVPNTKALSGSTTDSGSLSTVKTSNPEVVNLDFEENNIGVLDYAHTQTTIVATGYNSTNYKLSSVVIADAQSYGRKAFTTGNSLTFRGYFNADSMTLPEGESYQVFRINTSGTYGSITSLAYLRVQTTSGVKELRAYWSDDDGTLNLLGSYSLSAGGTFKVEFQMQAESADGQADGTYVVKVNGSEILNSSTLDNYNLFPTINNLYMGAYVTSGGGSSSGTSYVDEIIIRNDLQWVDSTGTLYYQSASGSETNSGIVKKKPIKNLSGSQTDSGSIFRKIFKYLSGSELDSGNIFRKIFELLSGSETSTGIATYSKRAKQLLLGSETVSGNIFKNTLKTLVGSEEDFGNLIKNIAKTLVGSETASGFSNAIFQSGLVQKFLSGSMDSNGVVSLTTMKILSGSFNSAGATSTLKSIFSFLSGSETSNGVISKNIKRALLGSETSTGEIFKSMFKFLLGDMDSSGNITKKISIFLSGLESSSGVLFLLIKKALLGSFDSSGIINSIKSIFYSLSGSMDSSGDISKKMFEALSGSMDSSGDISKKMFEALSGSFNSSGIINTLKLANKFYQSLSGSMDSSGDLYKLVQKLLSGTEISSGEIYRKIYKSLDGLFNSDGLVIKKMYEAFSGDQTDSGDITRRIVKLLLGSFDSSGEIFRVIKKIISGTQSSAGNVYKKIFLTLLGSFNSSGIVSAIKQAGIYYRSFSGSMDSSGDIRRSINKILLGASTFSGDISKKMFKFLFGDETSFGEISKRMSKYLSGILPSSGEILKKTYKNIFGDYTDSGSISKKVFEYLSGQLDSSGIITPIKLSARYYQSLFGSMDSSGSISRVIFKTVIGDSSFNGTISKKIFEFLSGSMNSSGLLNAIKGAVIYYQSLAGSMDSVGTITKTVSKTLVSISNFSGNIKRKVFKFVFGEGDFSGNIVRKIFKSLFGDTDFYGDISILRKFYILLSGTFSPTGETSKKSKKFLLGMSTFGGSIYKKISKLLNGIQSFIGVFTYYLAGERQYGTGILSLSKAQEALLSMTSSSAMDMEITKLEIEDNTFVDVEGDYDLSNITFEKINQSLITMSVSNSMSMAITKLEIEDDTFVTYEGDYVFSSITFEKINQILLTMNMKNNTKIIMAKLEIEGD